MRWKQGRHACALRFSRVPPAKCWPLLHVMAGISAQFSNFAFVLFCYITNHIMTGPLGNSEFFFPRISMFPETKSRETLRFSGNKIHCSPRDQSLCVNCLTRFCLFCFSFGFHGLHLIKFKIIRQLIFLTSFRNTSGSLEEQEMMWEQRWRQAIVSFVGAPTLQP